MNQKDNWRYRRGRSAGDFWAEVFMYFFGDKDSAIGKVASHKPVLETMKWACALIGSFMFGVPIINLYFMAVSTIKDIKFEVPIKGYLFLEPKWNFIVGVIFIVLCRYIAVTQRAARREPEFERMAADRTSTQKQMLLKFGEDDDIIKGTKD